MSKSALIATVAVIGLGLGVVIFATAQEDEGLMSDLRFVVLKNYNGTPVGMRRWCCIR